MRYNPNKYHRKTVRLKEYDYTKEGMYFVTICIKNREYLLGEIIDADIILSEYGEIIKEELLKLSERFKDIEIYSYVIMPNHIHSIIENLGNNKNRLGNVLKTFKSVTSIRCNNINKTRGISIWQRNYYEHIVRNEKELYKILEYIKYNPLNWNNDKYNK